MLSTEFVVASLGIGVAGALERQRGADPVRSRAAPADPPLAARAAPGGAGPRRSEDRPLQLAPLLGRARRGAGARRALRATGLADHGRPRPAARDQQLLRPPRRRRGARRASPTSSGEELRHYDVPARFGGEEFAILLPETGAEQALEIAERIRRAVARRTFEFETAGEPVRATISMGVASFPEDGKDPNELVHCADLAVYRAKLQGRNRVLGIGAERLLVQADRAPRLVALPVEPPPPSTEPPGPARTTTAGAGRSPPRRAARASWRYRAAWASSSRSSAGPGILARRRSALVLRPLDRRARDDRRHRHSSAPARRWRLEFEEGSISVGAVGAIAGATPLRLSHRARDRARLGARRLERAPDAGPPGRASTSGRCRWRPWPRRPCSPPGEGRAWASRS